MKILIVVDLQCEGTSLKIEGRRINSYASAWIADHLQKINRIGVDHQERIGRIYNVCNVHRVPSWLFVGSIKGDFKGSSVATHTGRKISSIDAFIILLNLTFRAAAVKIY